MGLFGAPGLPDDDPLVRAKAIGDERRAKMVAALGGIDDVEAKCLAAIKAAGPRGARWDELLEAVAGGKPSEEQAAIIEDRLETLMDRGLAMEMTLGILTITKGG